MQYRVLHVRIEGKIRLVWEELGTTSSAIGVDSQGERGKLVSRAKHCVILHSNVAATLTSQLILTIIVMQL